MEVSGLSYAYCISLVIYSNLVMLTREQARKLIVTASATNDALLGSNATLTRDSGTLDNTAPKRTQCTTRPYNRLLGIISQTYILQSLQTIPDG